MLRAYCLGYQKNQNGKLHLVVGFFFVRPAVQKILNSHFSEYPNKNAVKNMLTKKKKMARKLYGSQVSVQES